MRPPNLKEFPTCLGDFFSNFCGLFRKPKLLMCFFLSISPFLKESFYCGFGKCPMQPFTYLKLLQTCELIFQDDGLNWFENLNKSPWKLLFSQRFLHLLWSHWFCENKWIKVLNANSPAETFEKSEKKNQSLNKLKISYGLVGKSRPFYAFYNWFSFFLGKPTIDHSTFATQHSKEEQQQHFGDAKNPLHLAFFSRWAGVH